MKILVNQPILNIDGSEFKAIKKQARINELGQIIEPAVEETLLLVDVITDALLMTFKDDNELSGKQKIELIELARRTHKARGKTLEITLDEASVIKKRVQKGFTALVYVNVHEMFEKPSSK